MSDKGRSNGSSRRAFVQTVGVVGMSAGWARIGRGSDRSPAALRLFKSLSDGQRERLCFPWEHPLRDRVEHRWAVVEPTVGELNASQQSRCEELLRGVCSEHGFARFRRQMQDDAGGLDAYHLAFFGTPGGDRPFEWLITGRHLTIRGNGHAAEGGALRGPVFYGHDPRSDGLETTGGVWESQRSRAEGIVLLLDDRERSLARSEGVRVGQLKTELQQEVGTLLDGMLGTFHERDADGARQRIDRLGGLGSHRLIVGDRTGTGFRGAWRIQGPALSWTFLGRPHVHSWLRVAW